MKSFQLRNVGIIAHIDAGKTTLTERLLHAAGLTKRIGLVDRGDTVMDFLPQERARGITIQAACVSIPWKNYQINIIDTPGHVDFSVEVERAVRVMDGAVAVIDGGAGVQAQTMAVWEQSSKFGVRKTVFVNKLDKMGADYWGSLRDIESRLKVKTLSLSEPIYENGALVGTHDIIENQFNICSEHNSMKSAPDRKKHNLLLEKIAELDDEFLSDYLENQHQSSSKIRAAIRRISLSSAAVPVLAGSAFKNISVPSVLDSIVEYLPHPDGADAGITTCMSALAFKVICDEQRGLLVFVRVYSGTINPKATLYNSNGKKERITKIMKAAGKELIECDSVGPGDVAVLLGCKATATGDTLSDVVNAPPLSGVIIPAPVFQMACSLASQSEEERVMEALKIITLEDPSLRVEKDQSGGQIILSGMGELHLEITGQRLKDDFKCDQASFGKVKIAYKEALNSALKGELQFERIIQDVRLSGLVSLVLEPLALREDVYVETRNLTEILPDALRLPKQINEQEFVQAVKDGIELGLMNGPVRGNRIVGCKVIVKKAHWIDSCTTLTAIRHAAIQCLANIHNNNSMYYRLIEPIMTLSIKCSSKHLGIILPDLHASRRAVVFGYNPVSPDDPDNLNIDAEAPLSELVGYITWLRTATSGHASLSMNLKGYK